MLPPLSGRPIRVELRRSLGPHLAATSIPRRLILLDSDLLRTRDFDRILVHEIFHFAWLRLSNQTRRDWEDLLRSDLIANARGELGWSAEWRKQKLTSADRTLRSPAWRRYACESFCDSAAWLYAGLSDHDEFTLAKRYRERRRAWFTRHFPPGASILI